MRTLISVLFLAALIACSQSELVPADATWAYLDGTATPPAGWQAPSFDDSTWKRGQGPLGYSREDLGTTISFGKRKGRKAMSASFRHRFEVTDPAQIQVLTLLLERDDGAMVYLNGREAARSNMPDGPITPETPAHKSIGGESETTVHSIELDPAMLVKGENLLAISVHQIRPESSDLGFTLRLVGSDTRTPRLLRGPYLQSMSSTSVVVCWRSSLRGESEVHIDGRVITGPAARDHEIRIDGLRPATRYAYSIHVTGQELARTDCELRTAPEVGSTAPFRLWVIGDSGTADANSRRVYTAFAEFAKDRPADLWLMLGDNAYSKGTDAQFQAAVFDTYPELSRRCPMFSTRGNHAANQDVYYAIHANPQHGECGGLPSGTEAYYAVDYGNAHFICLDSTGSNTAPDGAMRTWLQDDLQTTKQLWKIAFFHHPPYSKGSHDSDAERPLAQIRSSLLPVLEQGGVDLVLVGHSHSYERSMLIHGHYELSNTFNKARMAIDAGDGEYRKTADGKGTVYVVAGNGGKLGGGNLNHPVMKHSARLLGSLVVDISDNTLKAQFLTDQGSVQDHFTITKE